MSLYLVDVIPNFNNDFIFSTNIKAITARKLGSLLLSKTMEISNISISSFDRMFPNQDTLPKGGYGNLIALPFQNEPSKYGNTLFIDRNFILIKNQMQYLSSIHKLTEIEVFEKIKQLSNETIDKMKSKIKEKENEFKINSEKYMKIINEYKTIYEEMKVDKVSLEKQIEKAIQNVNEIKEENRSLCKEIEKYKEITIQCENLNKKYKEYQILLYKLDFENQFYKELLKELIENSHKKETVKFE